MKQATLSVRPDGIVEAYSEEVAFTFDQHKILTIEVCTVFVYYRIVRNVSGVKFWCPQKNTLAEKLWRIILYYQHKVKYWQNSRSRC